MLTIDNTYNRYISPCRRGLLSALLAGAAGLGLTGCGADEPAVGPTQEATYTLQLQITPDGVFTRADDTWGDPYPDDAGTPFDRTVRSVDFFLVGADNSLTRLYAFEKPGSSGYLYTCEVSSSTPGVTVKSDFTASFSGRIMAVANIEDVDSPWLYPDSWTESKIPFRMKFGVSDDWRIPMWGVESYSAVSLDPDHVTDLGDIYLLRAVSKIIVRLDDSIKADYRLESISMADASPEFFRNGYVLPKEGLNVSGTRALDREGCFDPDGDSETIVDPAFRIDASGQECYTYVSESATTRDDPFSFTVSLKSLHPDERPDFNGTLYFSLYSADGRKPDKTITDVVRNHVYEFTITLTELELLTTVREWVLDGTVHIEV